MIKKQTICILNYNGYQFFMKYNFIEKTNQSKSKVIKKL